MAKEHDSFEEESLLTSRCSRGDRVAFDALWQAYRKRISNYIRLRVGDAEEAEDLTQEAFIRAWSALTRGVAVEAFAPWLYRISQNLVNDWFSKRKGNSTECLDGGLEVLAPGPTVTQEVAQKLSFEFLLNQLDEVLLPPGAAAGAAGHLRKLAFLHFYVDHLSLPEVQRELLPLAAAGGLPVPGLTTLNNWLSRGDILSSLIRHLVECHPDCIAAFSAQCLLRLGLSGEEMEIASMRWERGLSFELIAESRKAPVSDVARTVGNLIRRLTSEVAAHVKPALHEARKLT